MSFNWQLEACFVDAKLMPSYPSWDLLSLHQSYLHPSNTKPVPSINDGWKTYTFLLKVPLVLFREIRIHFRGVDFTNQKKFDTSKSINPTVFPQPARRFSASASSSSLHQELRPHVAPRKCHCPKTRWSRPTRWSQVKLPNGCCCRFVGRIFSTPPFKWGIHFECNLCIYDQLPYYLGINSRPLKNDRNLWLVWFFSNPTEVPVDDHPLGINTMRV